MNWTSSWFAVIVIPLLSLQQFRSLFFFLFSLCGYVSLRLFFFTVFSSYPRLRSRFYVFIWSFGVCSLPVSLSLFGFALPLTPIVSYSIFTPHIKVLQSLYIFFLLPGTFSIPYPVHSIRFDSITHRPTHDTTRHHFFPNSFSNRCVVFFFFQSSM